MSTITLKSCHVVWVVLTVMLVLGVVGNGFRADESERSVEISLNGLLFEHGSFIPGPYELKITTVADSLTVAVGPVVLDRFPTQDWVSGSLTPSEPAPFRRPALCTYSLQPSS